MVVQGMEGDTQQGGHGGQGAGGWYEASHPASPMPAQHHQVSAVTTRASNQGSTKIREYFTITDKVSTKAFSG